MSMCISVHESDLSSDRYAIMNVLEANRDHFIKPGRYDWLYLNNPAGVAKVWLAEDTTNGEVMGAAAAVPRLAWVHERLTTCYVMADFSINSQYRSLGPAVKLSRMTLSLLSNDGVCFAYDFPSVAMASVHRWMKYKPLGKLIRLVRPVWPTEMAHRNLKTGRSVAGLAGACIAILSCTYPFRCMDHDYSYTDDPVTPKSFDGSFDELDRALARTHVVCGGRGSAYLNWRYGENPLREFHLIRLVFGGRLCAYAIYTVEQDIGGNILRLYDLWGPDRPSVRRNLLAALHRVGLKRRVDSIEAVVLEPNSWIGLLKRFGFLQRPSKSEAFVFAQTESQHHGLVTDAKNWFMTLGDQDT